LLDVFFKASTRRLEGCEMGGNDIFYSFLAWVSTISARFLPFFTKNPDALKGCSLIFHNYRQQ